MKTITVTIDPESLDEVIAEDLLSHMGILIDNMQKGHELDDEEEIEWNREMLKAFKEVYKYYTGYEFDGN